MSLHFESPHSKSALPMRWVFLGITGVFLLGIGVLLWFGDQENTRRADLHYSQARDHFDRGQGEESLLEVNKALNLKEKPEYLEIKYSLLRGLGNFNEAVLVLERLTQIAPRQAHYHYWFMEAAPSDLERTIRHLRQAVRLEPDNVTYGVALASFLASQGGDAESHRLLEGIIRQDPRYYPAWEEMMAQQSNRGKPQEAIKTGLRAMKYFESDAYHHLIMGGLHESVGDLKAAVRHYWRSLEIQPLARSTAAARIFEITGRRVPPELENLSSERLPFEPHDNLLLVTLYINGQEGKFLFDTGAALSVIQKQRLARFKLSPSKHTVELKTINGTSQSPLYYGNAQMAGFRANNAMFGVSPQEIMNNKADGIIGMDLLGEFRLEIDQQRREIILHHQNG